MLDVEVCDLIMVNIFEADSHLCKNDKRKLLWKICLTTIIHILTQVAPCLMFGDNVDIFVILEVIKDPNDFVTLWADPLSIDFRDIISIFPVYISFNWNNFDADFKP